MKFPIVHRLLHETRRLIGSGLARYRLHHIRFANIDGNEVAIKTRQPGSHLAILFGNLYLFLRRSDIEVLSNEEWLRWEFAVQAAMNPGGVRRTNRWPIEPPRVLIARRVPGSTLRDILEDEQFSLDQKFAAFGQALDSLHQLHCHQADWGNGVTQSVSHGDATVNNVIVSVELKSACWIDFDIRHRPHLCEVDRQADDLRALIYSAAINFPVSCFPRLANVVRKSITHRFLMDRFRERLTNDWGWLSTFQLAQAPLPWTTANSLSQALSIVE